MTGSSAGAERGRTADWVLVNGRVRTVDPQDRTGLIWHTQGSGKSLQIRRALCTGFSSVRTRRPGR